MGGVSVAFHGKLLLEETDVVINYGNRYGFIGPNGSGKVSLFLRSVIFFEHIMCSLFPPLFILHHTIPQKSTVMKAIAARSIPIPSALDIYFLDSEYPARDDM